MKKIDHVYKKIEKELEKEWYIREVVRSCDEKTFCRAMAKVIPLYKIKELKKEIESKKQIQELLSKGR